MHTELQVDKASSEDLVRFWIYAWTSNPSLVLQEKVLLIAEPPAQIKLEKICPFL